LPGLLALAGLAAPAAAQTCTANYYRFEEGTANAAASGAGTLVDSAGGGGGTPSGGPIYRADVTGPIVSNTNARDRLSLEFDGAAQSAIFPSSFIFHSGHGDATLEFFIKVPDQTHRAIFWTRPDDDDLNRFNIAINPGGGFGFDYRSPSGELHLTQAGEAMFFIPLNTWHHVAVVRVGATYNFYLDGVFQSSRTDPAPDLPTVQQWQVAGRSGLRMMGLIDEIRLSSCALTPALFLINGCYGNCDGSTAPPVLNVGDFVCFQSRFAAADPYADCDHSATLNVADFVCFQQRFAAGCP
jgi:hypothetical protein